MSDKPKIDPDKSVTFTMEELAEAVWAYKGHELLTKLGNPQGHYNAKIHLNDQGGVLYLEPWQEKPDA